MGVERNQSAGVVYLVGAGSGDPGLITVRGAKLLERAEVVVYDALANPAVLNRCRADVEKIYVGKQAAAHSFTQEQINRLLVEKGLAGKRVVRLKGGDPFVFGRGGEECEALHAAGVRFEVVPGITAAIAASCYAGIPVTHRDFNSSFTFITGHEKEEQYQDEKAKNREAGGASDLDWHAIAKLPCVAFYMGVKSLGRNAEKLIAHGKDAATPVAVIQWGTWPRQRTVTGTLADIAQRVAEAKISPPALTIVGKVVTLRGIMNWFETRPLFGQTVVVTRTRQQASALTEKLEELGANVIEAPTIELQPPDDLREVDEALGNLRTYNWVIFTSQNGVELTKRRMMELGLDARAFTGTKVAAIGEATAEAVREQLCLRVDLMPRSFVAEALADELLAQKQVEGKKFLLLRADVARAVLREQLATSGAAEVRDVAVYETKQAKALPQNLMDDLNAGRVSWVTFTSSSTAKNFVTLVGETYREQLQNVKLASIGPITTATMRELGLEPTVQAEQFDIEGLVDAVLKAT
ncbi:MAG TPA: uroporphyrinogen-III C-methyltransferase [Tepidisphaeraceae bacterium]|jgi:uroporphyrinogen III methyltransferase/synthase